MLVSLEMFGFKSFAERTRFEFAEGITCVVGPNGSGKSNVVDSIKWILGDQSPKSLRGGEMLDVIFNGSKSAKPSGYAEALLTFDNHKRIIDYDAEEIVIGRRLYRSGDSEYLLNHNVVRLKDIRDLLMGTGCGLSAYNIIEQGRVGQILQANPTSRRQIFEEASGISRYKTRKIDALKKLEHVSQNLLRLKDIVDEVENQLNTSRSQASKAAKYRELSIELKHWWTGLALDDYQRHQQRLQILNDENDGIVSELTTYQVQHQIEQTKLQKTEETIQAFEESIRLVQNRTSTTRQHLAECQAGMRFHTERIRELQAEQKRIEQQKRELQQQRMELTQRIEDCITQFADINEQTTSRQSQLQEQELAVQQCDKQLEDLKQELLTTQEQLDQIQSRQASFGSEILRLETQQETLKQSLSKCQKSREKVEEQEVKAREFLNAQQTQLEQAREECFKHERTFQKLQKRVDQCQQMKRQSQLQMSELRESRSAQLARKKVLEDLELRQEGLGLGTREILKLSQTSTQSPWTNIQGTVADLIEVDLEYAALIDMALGHYAQAIVVDDLQPLVDYLDEQSIPFQGRVHFLELQSPLIDSVMETQEFLQQIPTALRKRVVGSAMTLVRGLHVGGQELVNRLLHHTWIVEDLTTALALRKIFPTQYRFVTLTGELIDVFGVLTLGQSQGELGLVSRRTELRQLRLDIQQINDDITTLEENVEKLRVLTEQEEGVLLASQQKFQSESQLLAGFEAHYQTALNEHSRIEKELEQVQTEEQRLLTLQADYQQQLVAKNELHLTQEQEAVLSRNKLDQLENMQEQKLSARKSGHALWQRLFQEAGQLQQQHSRLQQTIEQLEQQKEQHARQDELYQKQIIRLGERLDEISLLALNLRAESDEHLWVFEHDDTTWKALNKERVATRNDRQAVAQREKVLQQSIRKCEERKHELEFELRDLIRFREGLQTRMQEEYQMNIDEFVQTGHSAYQLWCENKYKNQPKDEDTATDSVEHLWATYEEIRPEIEDHIERVRRKIKALGQINTESLDTLDELEQRYTKLKLQLTDLTEAKTTLESIIGRMDIEMQRLFNQTYAEVRTYFQELFRKCFGGGEGDIVLEDPNNILDCGLEIVARPPGKELRSISLLSGGEKTMTAVALLLALFRNKPSPFCILDECDAALDEANIDRYVSVLNEFKNETQFIMITHRKRSMVAADRIYGVTMETAGISKRLSVKFEDVAEDGHIGQSKAA
jgi:chromosome segregation protein